MKRVFFILLIISLVSLASAGEIRFYFPEEVSINEEFTCEVETIDFSSDNYDVKIDILSNDKRIAEIFDSSWKSTYYYLLDKIGGDNKNSFKLRIKEGEKEGKISVKLRDSKGNIYSSETKTIKINSEEEKEIEEDEEIKEEPEEEKEVKTTITAKANNSETYEASEVTQVMRHFTASAIRLDSKDIKSDENSVIKTRNSILIYSLIGFGLLVTLLILLKRINFTKDEWRE